MLDAQQCDIPNPDLDQLKLVAIQYSRSEVSSYL